jgi:hypothetical protein
LPPGAAVPAGIALGSTLLGHFLGGSPTASQAVPPNLQGAQNTQLGILQQLLGGNGGSPLGNAQSIFGNFSMPQSDLQRQSAGGISQFLNMNSPAMQTQNQGFSVLQAIMNPSNNPTFQQGLSLANQSGNRFGSANEILRGQALTNMFGLANQAAGTAAQLGNAKFGQLAGGFGIGQQQAQQSDVQTQRLLQLLGGALGLNQQLVGGLPITTTPSLGEQFGQLGTGIAGLTAALPFLNSGSQGGGTTPTSASIPAGQYPTFGGNYTGLGPPVTP